MRKLFFASLVTILCFSSAFGNVQFSGERFHESRFSGHNITAIQAETMWNIKLTSGNDGISINVPSELAPYITCELSGNKLMLGMKNLPSKLSNMGNYDLTATVSVSDLHYISLSGACKVTLNSAIKTSTLRISASGMSGVYGSSNVECQSLDVELAGASSFNISNVECRGNAQIEGSGMSKVTTNLECKGDATLSANGASRIEITGSAIATNISCSGMSNYYGKDFTTRDVNVECSGASNAEVYVDENGKSDIDCSGMSNVYINGMKQSENHKAATSGNSHITYR